MFVSQIYLALRVFTAFKAIHLGWFLFFILLQLYIGSTVNLWKVKIFHLFFCFSHTIYFIGVKVTGFLVTILFISHKKFSYFSLQILFFSSLFYSYLNWVNPKGGHFVILSSWIIHKSWSPPYPINFSIRPKQMITCKYKKSFYFSIKVGLKN